MAANIAPIFGLTPNYVQAQVTVVGNNAGSNNAALIVGGTNGTRVTRITFLGNPSAGTALARVFLDVGGTLRLWRSIALTTIVLGVTSQAIIDLSANPLVIPSGVTLRFNAADFGTAGTFMDGSAEGMDF